MTFPGTFPRAAAALLLAAAGAPGPAPGLPQLVDVTAAARIDFQTVNGGPDKRSIVESTGSGLAFLDYDGDGWVDLFAANGSTLDRQARGEGGPGGRLYRNRGDGTFEDRTVAAGARAPGWAGGVAVADIDNDGWPDVLVTALGGNYLYRNRGDGTFAEGAAAAGVRASGYSTGAAFGDLDGDGNLDLYVARYVEIDPARPPRFPCDWKGLAVFCGPIGLEPAHHLLYRGRGDGTFSESTVESGLEGKLRAPGFSPIFLDYDGDGRPDIFVANDTAPNFLLHNLGGGRLAEVGLLAGVALSGDGRAQASMGAAADDLDGDGRPELLVTNFSHDYDTLYRNTGHGTFADESAAAGLVAPSLLMLGWANPLLDWDGDGDLDLLMVNGHVYPQVDGAHLSTTYREPAQLFRNEGRARFREVSGRVGPDLGKPRSGRAAALGDIDNDGDLDLALGQCDGPLVLLRNDGGNGAAWIRLRLHGRAGNRDGIGARVEVAAPGGRAQSREHRLQSGYLSSHDPRMLLGLGADERPVAVTVRWPGGWVERFAALAVRREHALVEGAGEPIPSP